jgi:prefoldin alpha subunit
MVNQELLFQASLIQKQSEELENHLGLLENQISELSQLKDSLAHISETNDKEMLSSLGKGVHLKTELKSKELYVEVGAGIVVKKTPLETLEVISNQLKRLTEAKIQLSNQLEIYRQTMRKIIRDVEQSRGKEN